MLTKENAAKAALEFLQNHHVGSVATASLDVQPSVSPVYYAVLPDFSIYFLTSHHSLKFKNLTINPKVAFSVGTGPEYKVVQISGIAHTTEQEEREKVAAMLEGIVGTQMTEWPIKKVADLESGGLALFKITPKKISFLDLTSQDQLESFENYIYEIM